MQISPSLNKKISQAVQTSMRIGGCKPVQSAAIKEQAKALMEQHQVQVSVRPKVTYTLSKLRQIILQGLQSAKSNP